MPCNEHREIGCQPDCEECYSKCYSKGCTKKRQQYGIRLTKYCSKECNIRSSKQLHSCQCKWCSSWKGAGAIYGIAVLMACVQDNKLKYLLGKENKNKMYNICTGGVEWQDEGCWINTAMRELYEEYNIKISRHDFIKNIILWWLPEDAVAVIVVLNISSLNINLEEKNNELKQRMSDTSLPSSHKEIEQVIFYHHDDSFQRFTNFTQQALSEIKDEYDKIKELI